MTIKNDTLKELIVICGIVLAVGYVVLVPDENEVPKVKPPSMEAFDEHPIVAWLAYDAKGGPCVRIRYEVQRAKTKLYMFDVNGKLVHQTPLSLSPFKDNRRRTETYLWKLYRTEWSSQIEPGYYTIVVGTEYDKRGLGTEIEVL
jgi:hypothetical protein|tara:strand:+ start:96 stop:530 length:435 start_codon:yes stop_codon:yes gene_type:complete